MKTIKYTILIIVLLLPGKILAQTFKTKHALIIAISNYPSGSGWDRQNPLSSSKDAELIEKFLEKQEFKANNISIVSDKEATKEGILKAIKDLTDKVSQGDVVFIHVSSHGEQIQDDNHDEVDGKDECIVPYGAMAPNVNGVTYENSNSKYLRDDDFGKAIYDLRTKLGKEGDVLVTMDCCHSGTGTRGLAKVRGGLPPLVSVGFKEPHKKETSLIQDEVKSRGDNSELATYITIAAARANELDGECEDDNKQGVGSLSYALSKVLSNIESNNFTYLSLFGGIVSIMNDKVPNQHPVLEGDGQNRKLFGGEFISQKPFFIIKSVNNPNEIVISGGKINGIYASSKIELFRPADDPSDSTKRIATGVVTQSDNLSAQVKLERPFSLNKNDAWVYVTEQSFGDLTISLGFENISGTEQTIIKNSLKASKDFALVKFDNKPDLILSPSDKDKAKMILKYASNGARFKGEQTFLTKSETDLDALKKALQQFVQYRLIKDMETKDDNYNLIIELLPYNQGKVDTSMLVKKTTNGIIEFQSGDTMVIRVTNIGKRDAYLNTLDLQPDGIINPILPMESQNIKAQDLLFKPGESKILDKFHIGISPPYGREVFKIFSSSDPINLEMIATSRGAKSRGNLNALEKLIIESYGITRGGGINNISKESSGTISEITFEIVQKPDM
ncbi:MAG: caspase family protein [Bacteroidia bacterium]